MPRERGKLYFKFHISLNLLNMNVESFYGRINEIIKDKSIIDHNKQEEQEYVKNNYDWSIIAKKFYDNMENIYDEFYHKQNRKDNLKD